MDKRTWWVIRGVYVFKNGHKPRMMLSDAHKEDLTPDIFPSREEAQKHINDYYSDTKYWRAVEVVEVKLVPVHA